MENVLKKYVYNETLEEYLQEEGRTECDYYQTFLESTNFISLKLFEGSITTADCSEVLEAREYVRMKLAEIEGETYIFKDKRKNVEERVVNAEFISASMLGTEDNKEQASEQFRKAVQMFAQTLTDEQAMEIATVYPVYIVGKAYKVDEMFTYGFNDVGDPQLYRVAQEHTSQENWTPDTLPALYTPIGLNDAGYPVWSQPTGAQDAYMVGDIVDYNGVLYKSLIDGNTYAPDVYPAGWEVYSG